MLNAEGQELQTSPTEALWLKHTGNLFMPVPDSATRGKQRIVSVLDETPQMQPDPASRTPDPRYGGGGDHGCVYTFW